MKTKNLFFFEKTNMKREIVVIALHWDWSLTWRFALYARLTGICFPKAHYSRNNNGISAYLSLPFVLFHLATQENMPRKPRHYLHPIEELVNELELGDSGEE